jgi:hypothetical protein
MQQEVGWDSVKPSGADRPKVQPRMAARAPPAKALPCSTAPQKGMVLTGTFKVPYCGGETPAPL